MIIVYYQKRGSIYNTGITTQVYRSFKDLKDEVNSYSCISDKNLMQKPDMRSIYNCARFIAHQNGNIVFKIQKKYF